MHSRLCALSALAFLLACGNTTIITIVEQPDATTDGAAALDAPSGSEGSTTSPPDDSGSVSDAGPPEGDAAPAPDDGAPSDASAPTLADGAAPADATAPADGAAPTDASSGGDATTQPKPEVWCRVFFGPGAGLEAKYGCNVATVSDPGVLRIDYGPDASSFCALGHSGGVSAANGCTGSCSVEFDSGAYSGSCTDGAPPPPPPTCDMPSCPTCSSGTKCCYAQDVCGCTFFTPGLCLKAGGDGG